MEIKNIVAAINQQYGEIKSVYFVGCGASKAELFPGKYFLEKNSKTIRVTTRPTSSATPRRQA